MIVFDTITSDYAAGAIRAAPAVNEDGAYGAILQKIQHTRDSGAGRRMHSVHRNGNVTHAVGCDGFFFAARPVAYLAQVDHDLDSQFRKTAESLSRRLRSTINLVVNFVEVADSFEERRSSHGPTQG